MEPNVRSGTAVVASAAAALTAQPSRPVGAVGAVSDVGTAGVCPNCANAHDGSTIFCEDCGFDFVTGTMPQADPPVQPSVDPTADPTGDPTVDPAGTVPIDPHSRPGMVPKTWMVVVGTDRAHYDRVGDTSVPFPVGVAERAVELADGPALIGRKSTSRKIYPEIDLSPAPEDVAVSRQHATLLRAADGTFTLEDLDSANGTFLNDNTTPIAAKQPIPIQNGDRVFVGAWTKLTLVML
jgi:hypothetical protein